MNREILGPATRVPAAKAVTAQSCPAKKRTALSPDAETLVQEPEEDIAVIS